MVAADHKTLNPPVKHASWCGTPSVLVVLVNWNGGTAIVDCVRRLRRLPYVNCKILIVDNASTDGSVDDLRGEFPNVEVFCSPANLGFAGGVNVALRRFQSEEWDLFWVLNWDIDFADDVLDCLVGTAVSSDGIGAVSASITERDRPGQVQFRGEYVDLKKYWGFTRRHDAPPGSAFPDPNVRGVPVLWGTCLMLTRAAVSAVGMLDERFFAYHEDVDYSIRLNQAGFRVVIAETARVRHAAYERGGLARSRYWNYYILRNAYLLWRLHGSFWRRPAFLRAFLLQALDVVGVASAKASPDRVNAALAAIRDVLEGKYGRWDETRPIPNWIRRAFEQYRYPTSLLLRGHFLKLTGAIAKHAVRRSSE